MAYHALARIRVTNYHGQSGEATPSTGATQTPPAGQELELRVDSDGEVYSQAQFELEYGGLEEWESAEAYVPAKHGGRSATGAIELRVDPSDGQVSRRSTFSVHTFLGDTQCLHLELLTARCVCVLGEQDYSRADFMAEYGGVQEWDRAKVSVAASESSETAVCVPDKAGPMPAPTRPQRVRPSVGPPPPMAPPGVSPPPGGGAEHAGESSAHLAASAAAAAVRQVLLALYTHHFL